MTPFTIICDTREKPDHRWFYPSSYECEGTIIKKLDTGDYGILGFENLWTIDRKKSVNEIAQNLCQPRFEREMQRMESFKLAVVLMEFDQDEIEKWPSQLPKKKQQFVRTSAKFLRKRIHILEETYGVQFVYGSFDAKQICYDLLKDEYLKLTGE